MTMLELLSAHVPGLDGEQLPLTALDEDQTHVHGELRWTLGGRRVPEMGFWSAEDVCLGEWWDGFTEVLTALTRGVSYTLDTGEQGASAFHFERSGSTVFLSLGASVGGATPHPDWQRVPLGWEELVEGVRTFKRQLRALLEAGGPAELPPEWKARLSEQV